MPSPKDPVKLAEYREKMSRIAKERGYGKWMQGRKLSEQAIEKMRLAQIAIGSDLEERRRRSERAKANGYGKWMSGRAAPARLVQHCKDRKGKTYSDVYGDRAEMESEKRRQSNRNRWIGREKKADTRPKHNADHRYSDWRRAVFQRDNFTCQHCKVTGSLLHAHHLKRWSTHPDLRFEITNGLTLCVTCHKAEHSRRSP